MSITHQFFHAIDGREHRLVLVCTAHEISASILYVQKHEPAQVVAHTLQRVNLNVTNTDEEYVFDTMLVACKEVCEAISQQASRVYTNSDLLPQHQKINYVSLYLSGPWVRHHAHREELIWDEPRKFTTEVMDALLERDIPQGHTRISGTPCAVTLNGYPILPEKSLGQYTKQACVSITESFVRFNHAEALFQLIHSLFNVSEEQVRFVSLHECMMHHAHTHRNAKGDYVVCGIYGVTTEIAVFYDSQIVSYQVLPFGIDTLAHALVVAHIAPSHTQAISLVELYAQDRLDQNIHHQVEAVLSQELDKLDTDIINGATPETLHSTPHTWHLYTNKHISEAIARVLRRRYTQVLVQKADYRDTIEQSGMDYPTGCAIEYDIHTPRTDIAR